MVPHTRYIEWSVNRGTSWYVYWLKLGTCMGSVLYWMIARWEHSTLLILTCGLQAWNLSGRIVIILTMSLSYCIIYPLFILASSWYEEVKDVHIFLIVKEHEKWRMKLDFQKAWNSLKPRHDYLLEYDRDHITLSKCFVYIP